MNGHNPDIRELELDSEIYTDLGTLIDRCKANGDSKCIRNNLALLKKLKPLVLATAKAEIAKNFPDLTIEILSKEIDRKGQRELPPFLEFRDLKSLPPTEWLIYGAIPNKGTNFAYGPSGEGKTFVAVGIAASVASDSVPWMGRITRHGHVIYIAAEDVDEVAQRFIAWSIYHHIEDLPRLHIFPAPLQLVEDTPKLIETIEQTYGDIDISLIVVDTLAMCSMEIEENSKKDFDKVIKSLESLWRTFKCSVLAVHHTGRSGDKARGTSSMDGASYSMMLVKKVSGSIKIHCDKMRRGKAYEDFTLDWVTVELPGRFDEMGKPITTGVLISPPQQTQPAATKADVTKLAKLQEDILRNIVALGNINISRVELVKACDVEESDKKTFIRAVSALVHDGVITMTKQRQRTSYSLVVNPLDGTVQNLPQEDR